MGEFSKSNKQLNFEDIANMFDIRKKSLKLYFSVKKPDYSMILHDYKHDKSTKKLKFQITEVEYDACLNLLAAIEALFRLDYIIRCEKKHKDKLSKRFKAIFDIRRTRVSLVDVIFKEWKKEPTLNSNIISQLKGAFNYRNWLAHGRYWTFKGGKNQFDFYSLYQLALAVNKFPLKR